MRHKARSHARHKARSHTSSIALRVFAGHFLFNENSLSLFAPNSNGREKNAAGI